MSTNELFVLPKALQRFHEGPLSVHIDAYASRLLAQGFSRAKACDKIRLIADLSGWLQRKGLGAKDIDPQILRRYLKDCKEYMHPDRGVSSTVQELLDMLCEEGIARKECSPKTTRRYERAEEDFKHYLAQERGLSARTLANYLPFVLQLLAERFGNGPIEFAKLRATDITGFVQRHARDHSPGRNGPMVAALRAFLRHLRHRGKIKSDLAACVPTIANWSHVTLPKFLPTGQVEQVLKHCDRRHTTGRRDYAILLLLARLGLRAGEVTALTLDDIDWKEGNLRLRGKGGREAELPLPVDVGEAITGYLQNGRPRCASRCLFISERAPRVDLASRAISNLVKRALVRAAVHSPRQGAHLFRHSLATEMLRQGASLSEIGELLRHQHPNTTMIYAKVDLPALRRLAPAWLGGGQ